MTKNRRIIFIKFGLMQAAYWGFYGSLLGFITNYMLEKGVRNEQLSLASSGMLLATFAGAFFWGRLIDRDQDNKKYTLIGAALAFVFGWLLYLSAGSFWVLVLYPVYGFMMGWIPTCLDAWCMIVFAERKDAVGKARSVSSISFAFLMPVLGNLISRFGFHVMVIGMTVFLALLAILALTQPAPPKRPVFPYLEQEAKAEVKTETAEAQPSLAELFRPGMYLLLLVLCFLTGLNFIPLGNMKPAFFRAMNVDATLFIGYDSFVGSLVQVPFLFFSGQLRRFSVKTRLLFAMICPAFYSCFAMIAGTPALLMIGTVMSNISYGVLFPTMREITEESVSYANRNTAHSLMDASYQSISGMIGGALSSLLIAGAGLKAMAAVCMCFQLTAVLITVVWILVSRFRKKA